MGAYGEHSEDREHSEGRGFDLEGSGASPLAPDDPRRIGPFPLLGLLGAGGMGRVYLGVASGRYTAVKRVLPLVAEDPDFLRHFGHELDNLARLPAGVSVPLLATDRTANPPWFATEYIPGLTLSEALRLHGGPLPRETLWPLLRDMAGRLEALHALDMVHRDLKPSNVMLTLDGLTLIDFGIARAADQSRLTKTGMILGTPEYMAPEQTESARPLTGAADVFALGSLLVYAATGHSPFGSGSGLEVLYRIVHSTPDLSAVRAMDPGLADVVAECLAKSPADRPTAADLLERAQAHARERDLAAAPPWPAAVAEQLEQRAAFAATVPALAELDSATADLRPKSGGEPEAGPAAGPEKAGVLGPEAEPGAAAPEAHVVTSDRPSGPPEGGRAPGSRKRRNRILITILPVVLTVGGLTAVHLLPYSSSPDAGGKPSTVVSPSVSPSAGRSGSASPVRPAHAAPSKSAHGSAPAGPGGAAQGPKPGRAGTAGGTTGAAGGTSSSGSSGGSKGGSSSGSKGGSKGGSTGGTGGTGGKGGTSGAGKIGSAGTYRIKDAADGRCLQHDTSSGAPSGYAVSGSCASESNPYFEWTFSPGPSGTFKVINKGSGDCLTAFMANGYANMDSCDGRSGQYWKIGARTSSGSTLESTQYWQCLRISSNAVVAPCDSSEATQLWNGAG